MEKRCKSVVSIAISPLWDNKHIRTVIQKHLSFTYLAPGSSAPLTLYLCAPFISDIRGVASLLISWLWKRCGIDHLTWGAHATRHARVSWRQKRQNFDEAKVQIRRHAWFSLPERSAPRCLSATSQKAASDMRRSRRVPAEGELNTGCKGGKAQPLIHS